MGYDPEVFWRQTPRLLKAAIAGYTNRERSAHREMMYGAWHGAAFQRAKKMPPLNQVLGDKRKAQTPEQMLAIMQSLAV
ncbi:hypothetical protein [Croceicoccus sp. YJ47]|uniref:hypothetical protein n=1 Tax=Croceicoccus sp. YJ47 TaxID=2798724 RepID=UPI0019221782|nr:hypothetical protein [Croceicoccus sp. YJ47]QQN73955.1 hypothetical protein JD971_14595 [Croceicoccus sp. YJ47]